jgi:hypothetical protein
MEKHNTNWMLDVSAMHEKFGVYDVVDNMDKDKLKVFLEFRASCIQEELDELQDAIQAGNAEGAVDALIDIAVFTLGTLDLFSVNAHKAWADVMIANMNKTAGIKEGRPNPLGLPDLIKNPDWIAPSHEGNHGHVATALTQ